MSPSDNLHNRHRIYSDRVPVAGVRLSRVTTRALQRLADLNGEPLAAYMRRVLTEHAAGYLP